MGKLFDEIVKESNKVMDEYKKLKGKTELKDLCKKAELNGMLIAFNRVMEMTEMKDFENDIYKRVANDLIDRMCDVEGIIETIQYFIKSGYNDDALLFLCFSKEDIEHAKQDLKEWGD